MDSTVSLLDIFASVVFIAISGIALLGNGTVLFTIHKHPCLKNSFNVFVVSLAFVDICNVSFNTPLAVVVLLSNSLVQTKPLCLVRTISLCLITPFLLASLTLMTINRYYRVVQPTKYENTFSRRRTLMMVVLSWLTIIALLSICLAALSPLASYELDDIVCHRSSKPTLDLFIYTFLIMLPTAVIVIFYIKTKRFIYKPRASICPVARTPTVQKFFVEEAKTLRVLLTLLFCSYCCVIPASVLWLVQGRMGKPPSFISVLVLLFQYLNTIVVPAVYVFVSRYYRKELWKIISCKCNL